ncbi:MAG: folylpolyglutamate synthase/dihydrofolate synthase family protein, partial [Candidatus Edwardsbacteria bacterium]|nr:folylpolyglutamate synthase/dihydrofolate synthase family protein [Candidatus Edwardsbacteria bacterium]
AVDYLMSFVDLEKPLGLKYQEKHYNLGPFRDFLSQLGNPQNSFKAILVAGTKGKGSTAALIESALRAQGFKTGLYTSPHLISFCERIRFGGKNILERDFAQRLEWLQPFLEQRRKEPARSKAQNTTVFEILTALAFLYFQEMAADWAVLEAGLGGRLDCTNVANPRVSVLTSISLDHTEVLGDTIAKIAAEKAGIIRQDGLVVTAPQGSDALTVILRTCQGHNARLFQVGRDVGFRVTEQAASHILVDLAGSFGQMTNLKVGLAGDFQAENAATAFAALRCLKYRNVMIPDAAVRVGFGEVNWPGRMQQVLEHPLVIVDGAHNRHSAQRLRRAVEMLHPGRPKIIVLGISANKDIGGIVANLVPGAQVVVITRAKHSRAAPPELIRAEVEKAAVAAIEVDNLEGAIGKAKELAGDDGLILIAGSLFLAGEALEILGKKS